MPRTHEIGRKMGCGCPEGTHGKSLSAIAPWHRGDNPWKLKEQIDLLDRLRAEGKVRV